MWRRDLHLGILGASGVVLALSHGCLARDEGAFEKRYRDDAGTPPPNLIDGSVGPGDATSELPQVAPHAVLGVEPPHGPFSGGQLVLVRGNGFASNARVWFGDQEIPAENIVPVDPKRVQVLVPPGSAGAVDVTVQNGGDASTSATLPGGYTYDIFYLEPASGPVSGGTRVTVRGSGTSWTADTEVSIDLKPCTDVALSSPSELSCTTAQGTPGSKSVRVTTPDAVSVDVLDAYIYGDSDNGFRGGLDGQPLNTKLRVIALDAYTGDPLPGATVVAGDELASALVQQTDSGGVTDFVAADLGPKRSVTLVKKCYQPITFVDVPVDTVTAYLDPVLSPKCAEDGDPPPTGGNPTMSGAVTGELIWPSSSEFGRGSWTNVPPPQGENQSLVAYVFRLANDPGQSFQLPSAFAAVTPDSPGTAGFQYSMSVGAGNVTLYALAGIEDRSVTPPLFLAYSMGISKGVSTKPGAATSNVFIHVNIPLDHALQVSVKGPTPTLKGPDRAVVQTSVRVGELGYVILPNTRQTALLPVDGVLSFVGVPPLGQALLGSQYVVSGRAVSGASETTPRSVAASLATTTTSQIVPLESFVEIPKLVVPQNNTTWDKQTLDFTVMPGGASVDLSVLSLITSGGLVTWTVAAPPGVTEVQLPDIAALNADFALPPGPLTVSISLAHIQQFSYGTLRYRHLSTQGWNGYATDVFYSHIAPP